MSTIAIDYETFYKKKEYSVSDLGNWRYTHDDRFDPYLLSAHDGENSWVGQPKNFNWDAIDRSDLLIAHNASFDSAITRRLGELGQAPVLPNHWQCTANLTSYLLNIRSLAPALFALDRIVISKSVRDDMDGKNWQDLVNAGQGDEAAKYALRDSVECWNLFNKYSSKWPEFEQRLSSLTLKQCARGVAIDVELLEKYIHVLQEVIFNLVQSFPWTAKGAKPSSHIAIAEQCRATGIPCPPFKTKDEEGFDLWQRTYGPKYAWVYGAGQWRSLGKLLSSLETIKERLRPDNTIDFSLLYFGAHTGRWSGGGSGLNLQNLKKVPLFLKNMHMVTPPEGLKQAEFKEWVKSCTDFALDVRRLFVARSGKKFILADLSQIEPRVLAWMTGNTQLLSMLQGGMNIYEAFARVAMGWTGGKLKDEDPDKYQLAKIQILGLGFGCGWEKFITIAAGYDVFLDEPRSKQIVSDFRQQNLAISGRGPSHNGSREDEPVGIWRTLDEAFKQSVGGDYQIELPSGRQLVYRDVRRAVKMKKNAEGKLEKRFVFTADIGGERCELYGGLLTENAVQATARDAFGEHLLKIEETIGDQIFHVHDEAITEVDLDVTPRDVEEVMAVTPEWLAGCPVAAEAKESSHYLK